jgi:signal transduction histidine kinase
MRRTKELLAEPTTRLALSYLAIIMLMSIGFSMIFYHTSSRELGRQLPPAGSFEMRDVTMNGRRGGPLLNEFLEARIEEGRRSLQGRLIALNLLTLLLGSVLSYVLARKTLRPIERNMEAQTQFVSDASHELRTPLTALRTSNEVALRQPKLSQAESRELLEQNIQEVIKLQALTDSLLRLARPEATLPLAEISLQDATADAINSLAPMAVAKNISLHDTVPALTVWADGVSLTQTLTILLDNAIKYSPTDATITLSGGQKGRYGYISVRDEGPGITSSDLPHIFDRFYRADQSRTNSQTEGFGIGLALAKKLVTQQNGDIEVTRTPGKGSVLTVTLPLVK